jgi:WD40 repeat protein
MGVTALDFSSDGKTLVSGGDDGTLRIWSMEAQQLLETIQIGPEEGKISQVRLSADGGLIAVAGGDGLVYVLRRMGK